MEEPLPERGAILKAAIGIGLYAMAGASFGAISVGSGLTDLARPWCSAW